MSDAKYEPSNDQDVLSPQHSKAQDMLPSPEIPDKPPAYPGPPLAVPTPTATVVHSPGHPVTIVVPVVMGSKPANTVCASCNMEISTNVKAKANIYTHLMAGILCLIGCWPCVWVPYCVDSCQTSEHYCPNCNAYIGASRT